MALDDALGAVDPQQVVTGLIGEQEPDLVQNGMVEPQAVMNRLIRKGLADRAPKNNQPGPQQAPADFSSFGRTEEEAKASPGPDFSEFGESVEEVQAKQPATVEKPKDEWGGYASVATRGVARGAIHGTGSAIKGAGHLLQPPDEPADLGLSPDGAMAPFDEAAAIGQRTPPKTAQMPNPELGIARTLKSAGKAVQDYGEHAVPMTPLEQDSITGRAAQMVGAFGPAAVGMMAGGAVGGPAGAMGVGAAMMASQSASEAYDQAIAKGADEQTAAQAAGMNAIAGGALGLLPLGAILAPVRATAPGLMGFAATALEKALRSGIAFASVGEAQEYLGQQFAKDLYDPNAGYSPDAKRIIASLIGGGIIGAAMPHGERKRDEVRIDTTGDTTATAGAIPPPGAPPGAAPGGEAGAARGAAPEAPKPFETTMAPKTRQKWEEKVFAMGRDPKTGTQEFSREEIRSWSDDELRARHHLKDYDSSAKEGDRTADLLREAGFTDEQVAAMSAVQRKAAIDDWLSKTEPEFKPAGEEAPAAEQAPQAAAEEGAGTRKSPVEAKTAEDVARASSVADQEHSPAQGEANNIQRGHLKWQGLDITIEAPPGGKRRGTNPETGEPWETTHQHAYGYFKGLPTGADGQHPDVTIGDHPSAPTAYVIDEVDTATGKFRQTKAFVGFRTWQAAAESYLGISSKDRSQIGGMRAFPVEEFVTLAREGFLSEPVSEAMTAPRNKVSNEAGTSGAGRVNAGSPSEVRVPSRAEDTIVTSDHHAAIEAVLKRTTGQNAERVDGHDVSYAAELHASGVPAEHAFQIAVVKRLIDDGLISRADAEKEVGHEAVEAILSAGGGAGRVAPPEKAGAATGGPAAEAKAGERANGAGTRQEASAAGAGREADGRQRQGEQEGGGAAAAAGAEARGRVVSEAAGGGRATEATERGPGQEGEPARGKPVAEAAKGAEAVVTSDYQTKGEGLIGKQASMAPHNVTAADGTKIKVVPVVVKRSALTTSFDKGYDETVQPRDRGRAQSQAQVREIATRLDPERLGQSAEADRGAPIVDSNGMVISGNGRIKAIDTVRNVSMLAARARAYDDYVKEQGGDAGDILVRQIVTPMSHDELKAFARAANQSATLAMSAPERAAADAPYLTPDVLDRLKDGELGSLENRPFVRAFMAELPASERGNLVLAEGGASAEGLARIRNALLAKAYGDADILARITESTDDEIKSISRALTAAAPAWAKMRAEIEAGRVPAELDATEDLVAAVKKTADLRSNGQSLDQYLAQTDAFAHFQGDVDAFIRLFYNPVTKRAASVPAITESLRFYADEASKVTIEAGLGLGLPEVTRDAIQRATAKKREKGLARPDDEAQRQTARGPGAGQGRPGGAAGGLRGFADNADLYSAEPGAEGKPQLVIPGAERASDVALAKRRAAAPLRAKVEQKPADQGLFADRTAPIDLFADNATPYEGHINLANDKVLADIVAEPGRYVSIYGWTSRDAGKGHTLKALRELRDRFNAPIIVVHDIGEPGTASYRYWQAMFKRGLVDELRDAEERPIVSRSPRPEGFREQADLFAPRPERDSTAAPSLTTAGPQSHIVEGQTNGRHPSQGIRRAAPAAPAGQPAGRVRAAPKGRQPGSPSLFDWGAGERPGAERPVQNERPGRPEPALPSEGGGVTKPPRASAGSGQRARAAGASGTELARKKIEERSRLNYRITDEDHIGEGGPKQKVRGNLEAIKLLRALEDEARQPTPEEKATLVKYVGWGAFAQDVFASHKPEWKAEREALRALLTEAEYDAALASTLNAHYTSPDVIRGMWHALDHLGFKGGLALEPSAGIGHFIGLVPDAIAKKTGWTAVELDPITGRIASKLYGGAEVIVDGFETLKRPANYYDLAISNVPFGDYNITEKPYGSFSIHDFFFVKALDKVRPGGVVAFITSRYTMDRVNDSVRRILANSSDLVGAIRLPGGKTGAFAGNAGTDVTTDILFLRKKVPGEGPFLSGHWNWMKLKEIETPEGPISINEYFANRPGMMLGEPRLQGTMFAGKNEFVLSGNAEKLGDRIAAAARTGMEPGAFMPRGKPPPPVISSDEIAGSVKDRAFFVKDGKLYRRLAGQGLETDLSADDTDRVRRMTQMRDIINDLLGSQLQGPGGALGAAAAENDAIRARLNRAYQAFVGKWGPINRETNTVTSRLNKQGEPVVITRLPNFAAFRVDPDAFKVAAIENYDRETDKATPADILTKDVIEPPRERQIDTPADALASSLDKTGDVDLDHIALSLGLDGPDAAAAALGDLVYLDPNGRQWQTAGRYLSGNVVQKLEEARAIAQHDKSYERNVRSLEKVQPQPLTRADITAQFGAPWVPEKAYEAFLKDVLGATKPKVHRVPVTGEWRVALDRVSRDALSKYGTERVSVDRITNAALNSSQITVWDEASDGKRSVNHKETEAARIKSAALAEAFTGDDVGTPGWVWKDDDRARELEAIYNRTHNNLVPYKADGSHLTLPGLNPDFATRQHRKDAVWRMIQGGNTLLAHVVGSGKTVTMIAGGMEMKRLGLINKPMYAVPNHMLEQFSREFIQAYPNAKILVAQKDEMTRDARKAFLAKVASNDWDGIIITHDAFGRINMAVEWRKQFVRDQLDELERIKRAEADENGKNSPTVKGLEKAKRRLEGKLDKLLNEDRKDEGTTFEESGVDFLFMDEAHKFKNLAFVTRLQRVKGLSQGESQRAEDLFLKIRYLEQKRPGRSAVFATGTPVSNTMAELWTMQRYLQLEKLRERELDTFDNWASTFGRVSSNMELSADGRTMKEVASFSKFVNVPELIALYSEIADTKTADMLKLPTPEVESPNGTPGIEIVEALPSKEEEAYIDELVKLAESLKGKRPEPGQPNMLSVVTRGRKVATDGRLVGLSENPNGKLARMAGNIYDIWKDAKQPGLVQMVFLDLGVPKSRSAPRKAVPTEDIAEGMDIDPASAEAPMIDLYSELRGKLASMGIPERQVAAIHDATDDAKKAKLFARVRSGDVRVLIGSTEKMGVGTNVQDLLIAMHHADAPWKPAEVEQRDGRIKRQGNKNPKVRILRYVTKKSFDAFMWQKLDTKSKFIGQVLSGAKGSRHAEDIDNPLPEAAEMKAAASGDPRILEHAELERQVRQLTAQRRLFQETKSRSQWEQGATRSAIARLEQELQPAIDDASRVEDLSGEKFKVALGDQEYTERQKAGAEIMARMLALDPRNFYNERVVKLGTMSGFVMQMSVRGQWHAEGSFLRGTPSLRVGDEGHAYAATDLVLNPRTDPIGLMRRYEMMLGAIKGSPERIERGIATERDNLRRIEQTLGETWPKEKEYQSAVERLNTLSRALKGEDAQAAKSSAGMPSLAANSDETGTALPGSNSSNEAPPSTQPSPGFQDSIRSEPSGSSTTRATPPSIFDERTTLRFPEFGLGDIDPTSLKNIVQGSNDINALHAAAGENNARFTNRLQEIVAAVPGTELYATRVKDLAGLEEKVRVKGRAPNTISDYLGGRIIVDTPEALRAVLAQLDRPGAILENEDFLAGAKYGYRAVHLQVALGDGTSAELQLVPRVIADVMHEAHALRQPVKRVLDKPTTTRSAEEAAQARVLMAAAQKVFDDAWANVPQWHDYRPGVAEGPGVFTRAAMTGGLRPPQSPTPAEIWSKSDGFHPRRGQPVAGEAQKFVLERGRLTGDEHLIVLDDKGRIGLDKRGTSRVVALSADDMRMLDDPTRSLVIHHNHPSGTGFSPQDIGMLGSPGLEAVWAHGHGGNVVRAALTERAKAELFKLGTPTQVRLTLFKIVNSIQHSIHDTIQKATDEGRVSMDGAMAVTAHVPALALHRGGLLDYRYNTDVDHIIDSLGLEPFIERAANAAAGVINGRAETGRNDRRAQPLRHLGDVGATFERGGEAPGRDREQARAAIRRTRLDRQEEAGQLRLFAEGPGEEGPQGFAAPSNPYRHPSQFQINETVASILEENNHGRLAAISRPLGGEKANVVEARVKLQDKFLRWKRIEAAVERKTGQKVPEALATYQGEMLYYGRTGERLERLETEHFQPLVKEIKKRGLTLEGVDKFLYARHAPKRNAELRKINPKIADPSGMSDTEAQSILQAIHASGKTADYSEIGRRVSAIQDQTLRNLVSYELLTPEQAAEWKAKWGRFYVPLKGWQDEGIAADHPGFEVGKGFDIRGPESKQALGRRSKAASPLSNVFLQAENAIIRGEKNKVWQRAYRFVEANPEPALWKTDKANTKRAIDPSTGLVRDVSDPLSMLKPNVVAGKIKGVPHYINFQGKDGLNLARALNNMGTGNMPSAIRGIATITRTMARMHTSLNPDFMVPNFVRDIGEAFINMQDVQQRGFVKAFGKHLPRAMGGSFIALSGGAGGKYAQAFREYDADGGRVRFFGMENAEEVQKNIKSIMRRLEGGPISSMIVAGEKALTAIEIANGAIENATRLAVYMAARDVGISRPKAASMALNMTVNFTKKGELGAVISGLYMFANAALQGTTRMMQAMQNKRVRRFAYGLAAASALLTIYNILAGGNDDDGVPYYMKLAAWLRDGNLIIMYPKGIGMDGKYHKIPLPYGYSPFAVVGSRSVAVALGGENKGKAIGAMSKSIFDAFDPLGKDENTIAQLTPTVGKPLIHLYTNTNWTGRDINPRPEPWNKDFPDSTRFFRSSSEFAQGTAERLNRWTGGTKREPGMIDIGPGTIDYWVRFATGGIGQFLNNTFSTGMRGYNGQEWDANKTPILRRFYGEKDPNSDRALYFEARGEVKAAHARDQAYGKDRTRDERDAHSAAHKPELETYPQFESVERRRRALFKEIDAIKADTNLSPAQREQQIKVKEQEELKRMAEARRALETARNKTSAVPKQPIGQPALSGAQ